MTNKINIYHGNLFQLVCTLILSLGTANTSFSSTYHSLVNNMPSEWASQASPLSTPWLRNISNLGGLTGSLLLSLLISNSKKVTLTATMILLTISWITAMCAGDATTVYASRFLSGVSSGLVAIVTPLWIAELSSCDKRATLTVVPALLAVVGSLSCTWLLDALPWQVVCVLGSIAGVIQWILGICFLDDDAGPSQCWSGSSCQYYLSKPFCIPLSILCGLVFFARFSVPDRILTFASSRYPALSLFGVMCVQIGSTLAALLLVGRCGAKWLLLISSGVCALVIVILAALQLALDMQWVGDHVDVAQAVFSVAYVAAFGLGLGPLAWLLVAEMMPRAVDGGDGVAGVAIAFVGTFYWVSSLVVTWACHVDGLYVSATFCLLSILAIFAYLFVLIIIPDIRKVPLHEIHRLFTHKHRYDDWCLKINM